jgi:hypothetical protein
MVEESEICERTMCDESGEHEGRVAEVPRRGREESPRFGRYDRADTGLVPLTYAMDISMNTLLVVITKTTISSPGVKSKECLGISK